MMMMIFFVHDGCCDDEKDRCPVSWLSPPQLRWESSSVMMMTMVLRVVEWWMMLMGPKVMALHPKVMTVATVGMLVVWMMLMGLIALFAFLSWSILVLVAYSLRDRR